MNTKNTKNTTSTTSTTNDKALRIECGVCKKTFSTLQAKQRYCSDECKAEGKREANRRFYRVHGSAKADPKNQARTLVEHYLWAGTGETLANGWTGVVSMPSARRTEMQFAKLEPMLNADAKRLLADAQKLVVMLNVRALCNGRHADLTTVEQSEQSLREALAVALDGLAQTMTRTEAKAG
ncbi:hypothetical protein [Paraburkholderia dipogonis]|uniref:hypothetical protein n=1 Tax=Paraburkholderia dipogonis TaxID=1211383 RepID=UPI0038BC76CE